MIENEAVRSKELVSKIDQAFAAGDTGFILSHMTDDVVWNMVGEAVLTGKKEVERIMAKMADKPLPKITQTNIVAEGRKVVAEGILESITKEGQTFRGAYCDSYILEDGKILQLNSYVLEIKEGRD